MLHTVVRHDWTYEEIRTLYEMPFMDLILKAQAIHRENFPANTVQVSTLFNIKVGGCPEDCHWCGQSVYHGVESEPLASLETVLEVAKKAKARGATRVCLAASWRAPTKTNLKKVAEMVHHIKAMGLETCITIGRLDEEKAQFLKENGLDYYNHNLETSENHFAKVSTTRKFSDRLATLKIVRETGLKVCSGGILGMGESEQDRLELLLTLANLPLHPESVPINQLVRISGTPLENQPELDEIAFVRCVALARILMPKAKVRLSGGRVAMSEAMHALCFLAGANSIHFGGPRLLVTPNVKEERDIQLFNKLGIIHKDPDDQSTAPFRLKTIPCVTVVPND